MKTLPPLCRRVVPLCFALMATILGAAAAEPTPRERLLLDFGWRFHLGDEWGPANTLQKAERAYGPAGKNFGDVSWRRVDLPHDWALEVPFDRKGDPTHGYKAIAAGFPQHNVGWYRRKFTVPQSDLGRRLWLEFDGIFRDALIYVNGWFVGHHESGYNGVRYDISDVANYGGENVVAVRVDVSRTEGWFYEGAGIYRHTWLVKTAPVAIAPDGIFVSARFPTNEPIGPAPMHLETRVVNASNAEAAVTVSWAMFAPGGREVARAEQSSRVAAGAETDVTQTADIAQPELWSPETPRLYRLITTVTRDGELLDRQETEFGIRTVGFDANRGFLLNGKPYLLKGTCNHQDHAGVGVAMPDRLQYFRVAKLKEMGSNAYRTAHNAPTPELLEACDRLGMLVLDENRLLGSDELHLRWLKELVLRDRNHPSVAIWGLANEEFAAQTSAGGGRTAATMQALIKRLDPTRPVTCNAAIGNDHSGINAVIDVRGWSYQLGEENMDAYHAARPEQPNVGSEQASTLGTRGIYARDPARAYVSAYDDRPPSGWPHTAEQWMSFFAPRPWLSGGFVWTGFDYRGEPTPFGWPTISSHFGILDTCGFPKDNFYFYQSCWTAEPMVHLLPHWNWAGREGQEIDVRAQSNAAEVELFLNGRSLGRQEMKPISTAKWKVPYAPGTLSAKAYRDGKVVAETKIETVGAPAAVQLRPDRASIDADGQDLSIVTVAITDAPARVHPTAGNKVSFELTGPGRIIGVGNGDPSCHEPDVYFAAPAVRSLAIREFRHGRVLKPWEPTLPEVAVGFDDTSWSTAPARSEDRSDGAVAHLGYRAHVNATDELLRANGLELWFEPFGGEAKVYLNGELLGGGSEGGTPSSYDVTGKLKPGDNLIAVVVVNWFDVPSLGDGATLRLVDEAPPVSWSRSAFNGLAQVIVQSTRQPGQIQLTARADGLEPSRITIETRKTSLKPTAE